MEQIDVKISATGEIEYKVNGIKGKKCRDLTKAIDQISGKVLHTENTSEFCQAPQVEQERIKE